MRWFDLHDEDGAAGVLELDYPPVELVITDGLAAWFNEDGRLLAVVHPGEA